MQYLYIYIKSIDYLLILYFNAITLLLPDLVNITNSPI